MHVHTPEQENPRKLSAEEECNRRRRNTRLMRTLHTYEMNKTVRLSILLFETAGLTPVVCYYATQWVQVVNRERFLGTLDANQ